MNASALVPSDLSRDEVLRPALELAEAEGGPELATLLHRVLEHVATEGLAEREPENLLGAVRALRSLAGERPKGQALVRVFSPQRESEGWSSRHSVVQLCTDDMPFLVDSVTAALAQEGLTVQLLVHPQLAVRRDDDGRLSEVRAERPASSSGIVESWMHLEIDRVPDTGRQAEITARLESVLRDVRRAVEDWQAMRRVCEQLARDLEWGAPDTVDPAEIGPTRELLTWLADDHFTFLGYREYQLAEVEEGDALRPVPDTGLGILRDNPAQSYTVLRPEAQANARQPRLLTITKANSRATVHRPTYLDYIGVRTFDSAGNVTGERRFLGMMTSSAYAESVLRLPIVSDKVREVLRRSGFSAHSHSGKDLLQVLESYPRDELFQADVDTIYEVATNVLHLHERRRSKLFLRSDEFGRFVSALVYIPRDRYNTTVRLRMEQVLRAAYGAETVDFTTRVSDSPLAQLHFVVRVPRGSVIPEVSGAQIQQQLIEATRTWEELLLDAALATMAEEEASALVSTYSGRFAEAYKEAVDPASAVQDLQSLQDLTGPQDIAIRLYQAPDANPGERRLKVYRRDPLSLTEILGTFTDLGVEVMDERPFRIQPKEAVSGEAFIYDFGLRTEAEEDWQRTEDSGSFEAAFLAVRSGQAESDVLGQLVLTSGLDWHQVIILRTIARYLRQVGSTFSVEYLEEGLVANPQLATQVVRLFEARFDPDHPEGGSIEGRRAAQQEITAAIESGLEEVPSLDHDRIIRAVMGVVLAVQRTNYYRRDSAGQPLPRVAMKLDCAKVPGVPSPVPMAEIWVYSPQVEGVHLRYGKIARGGLRWSDRREDFRTEVLGLVKAQEVKNAVIVPTGSKGGFFAKDLPDPAQDREAWQAAGKDAYRSFIRGMLDITDNRIEGQIVPPEAVVRHDGDDPYLVVAADKGTATFSDTANEISAEYGFWLDDAFASGGSAGYDHKAMGITARGGWESVQRHFRELGLDTQTEEFTVAGIGDMSGDVFGNGMLLSDKIRLVAAFDHRHIFLDPDPDAASTYTERRRLFDLPRSTWADYDVELISTGGGVHPRTAKSITLTPQVRTALGIADDVETLTPAELIQQVLLAPVDLLWNGGIGTYIKASTESHTDIGDRANDAIRVDGEALRCKVVGEGGNLGASQLGRIEAAMAGVHLNTDAIDNSAGVASSDIEVNIKILLTPLIKSGAMDTPQRNELLASMTEEVAELVLRDNYEQNVLLGNSRAQSLQMVEVHKRLIHWLEERGDLDRELEFLPSDAEIDRREQAGYGLMQPEFSVLVAYAKMALKADLAQTSIADGPWFDRTIAEYFPTPLRDRFSDQLDEHPLRSEIIVNAVVNSMVNRGGITFAFRAADETGAPTDQVARAFIASREIFGLRHYAGAVESLDNIVDSRVQTGLYLTFRRLLDRASRWFIHHRHDQLDVGQEVDRFADTVRRLVDRLPQLLRGAELARFNTQVEELARDGVGAELAQRTAGLLSSLALLDVVELAEKNSWDVDRAADLYFAISEHFSVDDLLLRIADLAREDRWAALARGAMRDDLYATTSALTEAVAANTPAGTEPAERIAAWAKQIGAAAGRVEEGVQNILALRSPGLAPLSVAVRSLRSLLR